MYVIHVYKRVILFFNGIPYYNAYTESTISQLSYIINSLCSLRNIFMSTNVKIYVPI